MHGDLGGRQREDQPSVACIDVLPPEHVAEEGAKLVRLGRVEQDVRGGDHPGRSATRPC
jgi:hypothetical protein